MEIIADQRVPGATPSKLTPVACLFTTVWSQGQTRIELLVRAATPG